MANKQQILDKIVRKLELNGEAPVRGADNITVRGMVISYEDAAIQSPMGGVDGDSNPFLGIGIANPGRIKVVANTDDLTTVFSNDAAGAARLMIIGLLGDFANDKVIRNNSDNADFTVIRGHELLGMGQ